MSAWCVTSHRAVTQRTPLSLLSISFLISTPLPPSSSRLELSVPCGPTYCPSFCVTPYHLMGRWPDLRWLFGDDMALLDPCSWAGVVGKGARSCGTKPGGGAHGERVMGGQRGFCSFLKCGVEPAAQATGLQPHPGFTTSQLGKLRIVRSVTCKMRLRAMADLQSVHEDLRVRFQFLRPLLCRRTGCWMLRRWSWCKKEAARCGFFSRPSLGQIGGLGKRTLRVLRTHCKPSPGDGNLLNS